MLRWVRLAGSAVLGAILGAGIGAATRPTSAARPHRPEAVERMLRALDAADRRGEAIEPGAPAGAALRAALRTAAEAPALDPASQGEVELVRRVLAGDVASLFAFGEGEPPSPPRARALLWLSQHGAGDEVRRRAKESYRVRYPDAWPMADGGLR